VVQEFISADDLDMFEGWLGCQAIDAASATPEVLAMWCSIFDEGRARSLVTPKVGLM